MEFRLRAGDDVRSSYHPSYPSAADRHFAAQALRAIPAREAMQRELLANEIQERRLLEDEVRRELELERIMAGRQHDPEAFGSLRPPRLHPEPVPERGIPFVPEARVGDRLGSVPEHLMRFIPESRVGEPLGAGSVPHYPDVGFNEMLHLPLEARVSHSLGPGLVFHRPETMVGERLWPGPVPNRPGVGLNERLPLPPHFEPMLVQKHPIPDFNPKLVPSREILQLSGTKRKEIPTAGEADHLQGGLNNWRCGMCQVTTTSEIDLNHHFQGMKHKAKIESLGREKPPPLQKAKKSDNRPSLAIVITPTAGGPPKSNNNTSEVSFKKNTSEVKQQESRWWCELCNVKCDTEVTLGHHLGGKKHMRRKQLNLQSDLRKVESVTL